MVEVYIDGASRGDPGQSGAGIFIKTNGSAESFLFPLGNMNNHEAEYHALIHGLKLCLERNIKTASFRTDSQLVERAVEKRFVKNEKFRPLLDEILLLIDQFDLFFIKWIPSKQNQTADQLARQAIHLNG
ncbi:reverse transcriptase-like protein [Metabacillus arenae]|uniref:Reverse transcriptase-like protein n=1 Tax=Metabacillus arenae TaxID=2771434 RepID=A0A926NIZ2_9BACI|nr:reverse transcriptase-like protein [Metabacillus arenae]MBD1381630.1 reverse transcriptase-like protein [Metabacillus arenae]